ncbi:MAG: histidinol dehydrogenase [Candidatus Brachytrichaceae bacterium NZ_4S206]|jgi:histidinol dehydrogenase
MLKIMELEQATEALLRRPPIDEIVVTEGMRQRTIVTFGEDLHPEEAVRRILRDVRARGDAALLEWTQRLDGVALDAGRLEVSDAEIAAAYDRVDSEVVAAMERAAERIARFHARSVAQSWMMTELGGVLGQLIRPLARVGVYVPAGAAPLPSSLLMTAIVARQAGVEEVIVCSPPQRESRLPHPLVLVAADIADVDVVYAVGGAQAIGAMAYGTETIERVDKVCGPGNTFVVLAKRQVYGVVGIDSLPGPTETVIVADESANPAWVAADMMAQAEHTAGMALLLTPSRSLAEAVAAHLQSQITALPEPNRSDVRDSFAQRSGAVITEDLLEAVALADDFAPEHLCLSVKDPWAWLDKIRNAGGVFVGEHSYEVLGDYVAGPSHVMPTGGTARFAPPLNVLDFMRVMNVIALDEATAQQLAPVAAKLAEAEGLHAHANAVRQRLPRS